MDIKVINGRNKDGAYWDELYINGEGVETAYPIYRKEFKNHQRIQISTTCSKIVKLMQQAFDAGKAGEEFNLSVVTEDRAKGWPN